MTQSSDRYLDSFDKNSYLSFAMRDFKSAQAMLDAGIREQALVLYQQAIEKALKHRLQENGTDARAEILSSHNIVQLADAAGLELSEGDRQQLRWLSNAYITLRYPTEKGPLTLQAQDMERIRDFAHSILSRTAGSTKLWCLPLTVTRENLLSVLQIEGNHACIPASVTIDGTAYTPVEIADDAFSSLQPSPGKAPSIRALVVSGFVKRWAIGPFPV